MNDPLYEDFSSAVNHAIDAHQLYPNRPQDAIRFWDGKTPYVIHPLWCAMTLLTETALPDAIRIPGYRALLWHDILEDTRLELPPCSDAHVREWVEYMTFENFAAEQAAIWDLPDEIKLLKLYDKTSILLDAVWMADEKWNDLVAYTLRLADFVEQTYGVLNIVRIARAVALPRAA